MHILVCMGIVIDINDRKSTTGVLFFLRSSLGQLHGSHRNKKLLPCPRVKLNKLPRQQPRIKEFDLLGCWQN